MEQADMSTKSIRRELFAQFMAAGMDAAQAFARAGFRKPKNEVAARAAYYNLNKTCAPRIAELIGANVASEDTKQIMAATVENFRRDLPWCREKLHQLIESDKTADYIKLGAIRECLTRALGLPIQYVEQNLSVRYQISDQPMTEDQWAKEVGCTVINQGPTKTEH
jgi:hypothetical protein